jgi:hypothetical protein
VNELVLSGQFASEANHFQWKMFALNGLVPTTVPITVLGEVYRKAETVLPQTLSDSEAIRRLSENYQRYATGNSGVRITLPLPPALNNLLLEFYSAWKEHKPERLFPIETYLNWKHKTLYEKKTSRGEFMPVSYAFDTTFISKPSNLAWIRKEIGTTRTGELILSKEVQDLNFQVESYKYDFLNLQDPTRENLDELNKTYFPGYKFNVLVGLAMLGQNREAEKLCTEVRRVFHKTCEEYVVHYCSLPEPKNHPGFKIWHQGA